MHASTTHKPTRMARKRSLTTRSLSLQLRAVMEGSDIGSNALGTKVACTAADEWESCTKTVTILPVAIVTT